MERRRLLEAVARLEDQVEATTAEAEEARAGHRMKMKHLNAVIANQDREIYSAIDGYLGKFLETEELRDTIRQLRKKADDDKCGKKASFSVVTFLSKFLSGGRSR